MDGLLVLKQTTNRKGQLVGFDVIRETDHVDIDLALGGLNEADYVVVQKPNLQTVAVTYVTTQVNHRLA
jgi:hypothetical protein